MHGLYFIRRYLYKGYIISLLYKEHEKCKRRYVSNILSVLNILSMFLKVRLYI